jgi:CheY-like chemotaxis protein
MISTSAFITDSAPPLLVVEDSNEDFEALNRFLSRSPHTISVHRCINGDQALAYLYRQGRYAEPSSAPRPGMILLDLNLPGTDGRDLLCQIKRDDYLKTIPVVVFTTSNNPKDIEACYRKGANSYIIKPVNFNLLRQSVQTVIDYWFEISTLPQSYPEAGAL